MYHEENMKRVIKSIAVGQKWARETINWVAFAVGRKEVSAHSNWGKLLE